MWRIDGQKGRFIEHDGIQWRADPVTAIRMQAGLGQGVPTTPTGPVYEPPDERDETGLFLLARLVIPGRLTVTGSPPPAPDVPYDAPSGVIF